VKIVHFSDLHLEAGFAWMETRDAEAARRRRRGLRQTLKRILELAVEERADALLCGGDLYEHNHFKPDTVEFVSKAFAEVDPLPIYLAPGNHDWLGPESLYRQAKWSPNVHVFDQTRLQPATLADGLTLWGGAHVVPANSDNFLDGFRVDRSGLHLALFHGSEQNELFQQDAEKAPHAPFRAYQIAESGLDHAFLGHFHKPAETPTYTYPGNPDPLNFGEEGVRGAVVATIHPDGHVERAWKRVASTEVRDIPVEVSGCTSADDVLDRVRAAIGNFRGVGRLTLRGALAASVDLSLEDLKPAVSPLEAACFRLDVHVDYDFRQIEKEPTVRGQFVQDVLAAGLAEADERAILVTGLRALDRREDLVVELQ
jgi:DNA repair protein SbcD/Mre11